MNYLLDTHIWLWAQREPDRLPLAMMTALRAPANKFVSAVSLWETALLVEKRRLDLPCALDLLVQAQAQSGEVSFLGLSPAVALEFQRVRLAHPDPADRLIVATARVHGLTLMTADRQLLKTPGVACWRG